MSKIVGVLVINSTCTDKRNSCNHDITKLIILIVLYSISSNFSKHLGGGGGGGKELQLPDKYYIQSFLHSVGDTKLFSQRSKKRSSLIYPEQQRLSLF